MRFAAVLAAALAAAAAGITLPTTIASSMVLQRGAPFTLWGLDAPGSSVTVTFMGQTYKATTDASGRFEVAFPATPATTTGQTITFTSSASPSVTISDVLVGDVIICSGQSNMVRRAVQRACMPRLASVASDDAHPRRRRRRFCWHDCCRSYPPSRLSTRRPSSPIPPRTAPCCASRRSRCAAAAPRPRRPSRT